MITNNSKAPSCTCPSGDGSLVHPCPAHPAVEQAGGDERDFQAKGAQEVPSPVSKEYDRHLIGLLRKGEALPGHQEEAADEIERLRDWNDHLNNTVLPNILNPNFLMLMKGGERLLDLCTKDGKFIGVSLNDMKDVFDWMVTHARIAPDHAALAQPSPTIATAPTYQFHSREIGESDWAPCDFSWYLYCSKSPEMDTRVVEVTAQPSPAQAEGAPVVGCLCGMPMTEGHHSPDGCCNLEEFAPQAQAEQAEAERREVVDRVVHSNPIVLGQCGPLNANDELMTVAQHAASVARWAEMFNRVEQERDAALARVAELERGKVYVEARRCDECQHGGINDSATGVAACHECDWTGPEPEEDKCPGCQRENCMAAACPQCGAQYVLVASEEIAAPVAQAQQLHDLDKQCRDDVARALGLRPSQERGFAWSYLLASIKSCVKAAEDTDQAQHSVPEGWMLVECGIWTQEQVDEMQKTVARFRNSEFVDDRALAMAVADAGQCKAPEISLAELLAAAPGKEGL
ncbi:hypothetical protein [Pseudomonas aeruginosa]|uniref:hypothetical protein n=1 Tax=Pseudomonas aeruginosa TaxID=287 RepID=UPI003DA86BF5